MTQPPSIQVTHPQIRSPHSRHRRSLGTLIPSPGVSHAPHLLASGPGRFRLLVLGPCTQDFAFLQERPGPWARGWGGGQGAPPEAAA